MHTLLKFVEQTIYNALIAEVSTTPKPGLVDCNDSGAHKDMDYKTFVKSTNALTPYLVSMFQAGLNWNAADSLNTLFSEIRQIGIAAEQAMFAATAGINTHKGMIFSMGTIAAAAGLYYQKKQLFSSDDILLLAGKLCRPAMEQDFAAMNQAGPKTHGEKLYIRHGYKGIRGEALEGFPSIRKIAYPYLDKQMKTNRDNNLIHINTLFLLMSEMDDTNVLIRTNPEMLSYMKGQARQFLEDGGAFRAEAKEYLVAMNQDFIDKNISPGGCADLLAVTIFLWNLGQYGD